MISILLDEAVAFDMLSIVEVKLQKGVCSENDYVNFYKMVSAGVGAEKMTQIISSKYYEDLVDLNLQVFNAVELSKIDSIKSSEVNKLNYDRYLAKKELQKQFFKNSITERKN